MVISWLSTSGIDIRNETGSKIVLHAIDARVGEGEGITLSDVQKIKTLGFNAIRLSVYWGRLQPNDENTVDETYFTTGKTPMTCGLDAAVNWAVQEGMYLILCLLHTASWPPPAWAFLGVTDDSQRFTQLYTTATRERNGIINSWKAIASRYANVPNILFELSNEPYVSDHTLAGAPYKTFNESIIHGIETSETRSHLKLIPLLLDGDSWMEIIDTHLDVTASNAVWITHHYAPMNSYDPNGRYWHETFTLEGQNYPEGWGDGPLFITWRMFRVFNLIHSWGKPWMITEFSKNTNQPYWREWLTSTLNMQVQGACACWTFFCYSSNPNFNTEWNVNTPAIQAAIMSVLRPFMVDGGENMVQTDASGNYTLPNLVRGNYTVQFVKTPYVTDTANAVVVAGQTATVNKTLLFQKGTISGKVTDEDGANVAGCEVTATKI